MPDLQLPYGGEIWKQSRHPFMRRYIVTGVPPGELHQSQHMVMSSDPRQRGNTLASADGGRVIWDQEALAQYLDDCGYTCQGQLRDLLLEELEPGHLESLEELGREDTGRGNRDGS